MREKRIDLNNIFDNEKVAIKQLMNDKYALLEGYVTEQLFFNQFLKNNSVPHSDSWWVTSHENNMLLFVVKEHLNPLDIEIMSKFKHPNQCWQVYLKGEEFVFTNGEKIVDEQSFVTELKLSKIRNPLIASDNTRDVKRQNRAIQFFKENNIIKEIAVERRFANNFLTVYFKTMINVDFFTKKNNQYNVIEVKYKYESKDGYFGINTGQMHMFNSFIELGFSVYHFILYNYTKNKNLSIFGFLDLPSQNKNWHYIKINDEITSGVGIAPEMTSVSGRFKQSYYKILARAMKDKRISFKKV